MSSYFLLVLGLIISTISFIYVVGNLIDSSKGDKNIKPDYNIKKHKS